MFTPRRVLLFLFGIAACCAAYFGYSTALGSVDGLRPLPAAYLLAADGQVSTSPGALPPTYALLAEAFGPNSKEALDNHVYKSQFELRDKGLVFAVGAPVYDGTENVVVSPVSVAMFGKNTQPGEAPEITTFHADKAILRFDRPIATLQDFHDKNKSKLKGIELVPNPEMEGDDPRRGQTWITHNQKSRDDNDKVVIRTPGRLFYQVPDEAGADDPNVPNIWTADPVEVVDRKNLPVTYRYDPQLGRTGLARPDDLRRYGAIAAILLDAERPPPTLTATGLKIFLKKEAPAKPGDRKSTGPNSSIREIVLLEKVQMNLWTKAGGGLPGERPEGDGKPAKAVPAVPGLGHAAVLGIGVAGAAMARQHEGMALVLVETPGSFRYDFEKSVARFDKALTPPAGQQNLVSVVRFDAVGGQDNLFCEQLVLEFDKADAGKKPAAPTPAAERGGDIALRRMTATGSKVYVSLETEKLVAQGTSLVYERFGSDHSSTVLRGAPVLADREGSRMQAGGTGTPGEVVIDTLEAKPNVRKERLSTVQVRGPGTLELHDQEQNRITGTARWGKQLRHEKVLVADKYQDLLKFEGGGAFVDQDGDFKLSADTLFLWLKPDPGAAKPQPGQAAKLGGGMLPDRLEADGRVDGSSPDMKITRTDKLFVSFRDIPPPAPPIVAPPPMPPPMPMLPPNPLPVPPVVGPPKAPEPPPAPNPIHISASVVHTRVNRYPTPPNAPKVPAKPGERQPVAGGMKYELENALCEERVDVEQAPDPKATEKSAIGLKINGRKLNLDQSPAGASVTVYGTEADPASVQFETSSLYGPHIDIDQPNNSVRVKGRGKLRMKSGSDLSGNETASPGDLEVTWAKEMRFDGAKSYAEFVQNVTATQKTLPDPVGAPVGGKIPAPATPGPLEILPAPKNLGEPNRDTTVGTLQGYRLDLTFDRPVYFSQLRDDKKPKAQSDRPKLKRAVCLPVPEDERDRAGTGSNVYFIEEVTDAAGKPVRARRLQARQLEFENRDKEKEQILVASGDGELRLLQFEAPDAEPGPKPAVPDPKAPPPEMKLTVVTFVKSMKAKDVNRLYQEAVFEEGADVVQIPTTNLNLAAAPHELPAKALRLKCRDLMTVSSARTKPEAPPSQQLVAVGNAEFWNETYQGMGEKVTYTTQQVVLDGTPTQLARMYQRDRRPNETSFHQAEQIIYKKDGSVSVKKSGSLSISPQR